MAEPLATIDRLAARVGEAIESAEDVALAEEMLEAASTEVRFYGLEWPTASEAPAAAVNIVLAAASRAYQNPGGLAEERGDQATLKRADGYSSGVELTAQEIQRLKQMSGRRQGIRSVQTTNDLSWSSRRDSARKGLPGFMAYDWTAVTMSEIFDDRYLTQEEADTRYERK